VMEMLEGESLEHRVRRFGALPLGEVLRLMRQVASSLGAAHARGIVHRDIKPDNIFIVHDPEVVGGERTKLLDFGIAKLAGDAAGVKTQTSALMGTPVYMSPEQCRGAGQVDQRSDIYSLGCVMFQLVAGRPPFDGEGAGDILVAHMREPAPLLSSIVPGIPSEIDAVVARCLAKDPDQRYASAAALASELGALLGYAPASSLRMPAASMSSGIASAPTTLSSASSEVAPAKPRNLRVLVASGVAIAMAIVIMVVAISRDGSGGSAESNAIVPPPADAPRSVPAAAPKPAPPPPITVATPEPPPDAPPAPAPAKPVTKPKPQHATAPKPAAVPIDSKPIEPKPEPTDTVDDGSFDQRLKAQRDKGTKPTKVKPVD
jgi:eukaryotic-like serine/threonine-protein kinase